MARLFDMTIGQNQEFVLALQNAGMTLEMAEQVIKQPQLAVNMTASLQVPVPSTELTPVSQYASKLHDWNDRFDLGLTAEGIAYVTFALPDHVSLLQPTGISLTLGSGLQHDWNVAMQALKYEVEKLGVPFAEYFNASRLSYFPGSQPETESVMLDVALLDFQTFWNPEEGIVTEEVRKQLEGQALPALEVAWFLALNPQVFLAMDGKTMPYLLAAGLVVDSDRLPYFYRGSGGAYVGGRWSVSRWLGGSVVSFREGAKPLVP